MVEGNADALGSVSVRRDPHPERVRLVDDRVDLGRRVISPGGFVTDGEHSPAGRDLDPIGSGPRPVPYEGATGVRAVGDRRAVEHGGRREQVAVAAGHAHHAVGEHARTVDQALIESTPQRELDVVRRQITQRGDPTCQRSTRVGEAVERLLLWTGHQRPGEESGGSGTRVADQMDVRVNETGNHAEPAGDGCRRDRCDRAILAVDRPGERARPAGLGAVP